MATSRSSRPLLRPTAIALAAILVGVGCVRTDARHYFAGEDGVASFRNPVSETVHLPGCAPFTFQRSLDGSWTDAGPPFVCVWEGYAVPVASGETLETPFQAPGDSGRYRLHYQVGAGCRPDRPLSQAECERFENAFSNPFEVERELCEPSEPGCRHGPAAPNTLCEDGVHFSGPSDECTRDPATGDCGYEFLRCP